MMKIKTTCNFLIALFLLVLDTNANPADSILFQHDSVDVAAQQNTDTIAQTISIIAVGDIMLGTNFPSAKYLPPQNDCWPLLEEAAPVLQSADIRFGNLEGCFLNEGPVVKKCEDTTKCYAFRMPVDYSKALAKAGFNMVSIANNHIRDFGNKGIDTTLYYLDKHQIRYSGLKSKPFDTLTVHGLKVGLLSVSPFKQTVDMNNHALVAKWIHHLDTICDIVLVSFHGGAEGKDHMNITRETEYFYGEDRGNVWAFAHMCVDAGADMVIGHGPHVPRAVELYKGRFICYSLGNFCTYARFNLNYPNSLTPVIRIELDSNGKALKGEIISMIQRGEGGPQIDELKRAFKLVKTLSKEDFPESRIVFQEDGTLIFSEN